MAHLIENVQVGGGSLLTEAEVGKMLRVKPRLLRHWRCQGTGPAFIKLGNGTHAPVRYRRADLDAYLEGHRKQSTYDPAA